MINVRTWIESLTVVFFCKMLIISLYFSNKMKSIKMLDFLWKMHIYILHDNKNNTNNKHSMKTFVKAFALVVAISAVTLGVLEVVDFFQMIQVSTDGAHQTIVDWRANEPWQFVQDTKIVWMRVVEILSLIFIILLCVIRKKSQQDPE